MRGKGSRERMRKGERGNGKWGGEGEKKNGEGREIEGGGNAT